MSSLHQHAKDLFLEALARPAGERSRFLNDACGTDASLRQEVDSLLAFHSDRSSDPGLDVEGSSPPPGSFEAPFAAGEMFAGRYRMIARIGRGGMGDVWRADDLVLQTPVALKLIHLDGPEARERIAREVRLARQITHPSVCRVFDVGESEGQLFFSMELVQGEDLATLLRRVGRLPAERVIEIGRQLCAGLAAAHAQNVLHRDLKPANVLIDDRGRVLITDFGIASPRTDASRHTVIGTPGYMAPEQMSGSAPLTERTDLYALGLVLYELVVGLHPFERTPRTDEPARPSTRVPVDARLERTILKALAIDPRQRHESATAMAASLEAPAAEPVTSRRRQWRFAAVAGVALVGALVAAWSYFGSRRAPVLTAQDTIVLADFANTTGEPVFDGALKVALAVALEQSPFLRVFSDDRVQETLRLMGRAPDEPVTRPIAREIAQRQELKALLAGSIAKLGRNYVIALEAINAQTGDAIARQQVEVGSQEEVLTALGKAVSQMRGTFGESLASIRQFDAALPRATTSSLEALHAYSLALDHGIANPRPEAVPHLKRAIELDPNFAMALAFLATVYSNGGQTALAPDFAQRAYDLRDRVSERERFFIAFRYLRDGIGDWEQALELTRSWVATYPREAFAFNSLGTAHLRFGQYEASLEPLRTAIRLDPGFLPPYGNLATSLMALNRIDDAKQVLRDAVDRTAESATTRRLSYALTLLQDDRPRLSALWDSWTSVRDATYFGWHAHVLAFDGRLNAAHEEFRTGIQMARRAGLNEVAAQIATEDAEAHATVGQCDVALREVSEALQWSRDNFTLERGARAAGLCRAEGEVSTLAREMRERFRRATFTQRVGLPLALAASEVMSAKPAPAFERLEAVRPYEQAQRAELWPAYLRGLASLELKKSADAGAQFLHVIEHRGADPDSQLYALAYLGLGRALAEQRATDQARVAYDRFLALWSEADQALLPLVAARAERARLP